MILSIQNKIIKQTLKLKTKKEQEKTKLVIIEGERFINQIPNNIKIEYYLFSESFCKKIDVFNIYKDAPIYITSDDIFKKISETVNPQGALAICNIINQKLENIPINKNSFFIVLDRVMDPGNLGSIIRSADALGVSAIIMSKGCVNLYNDKVLRATMGSIFNIPIVTNYESNEIISYLKHNEFNIICTHLKGNKSPFEVDLCKKIALIIGNEANGVLDEYSKEANELIKIPMIGKVESMNVSIASSIMFYEVLSQRLRNNFY